MAVNARYRSVSFAKCTPLTNEQTDHTPLNCKKETVHRNVDGLLKQTRESVLFVKELRLITLQFLMTEWIITSKKACLSSTKRYF